MFIAHAPAGYLLSRIHPVLRNRTFWLMVGSVLPDVDMAVFCLIGDGATHHHSYLTHRPALWTGLFLLGLICRCGPLAFVALGGLLHVALDSGTGAIAWAWPFSDHAMPLIIVPATQDWWVLSFVLHWSFLIELAICTTAWLVWRNVQRRIPHSRGKVQARCTPSKRKTPPRTAGPL